MDHGNHYSGALGDGVFDGWFGNGLEKAKAALPGFEFLNKGGGEVFVAFSDVDGFAVRRLMVVEFEEAAFVLDEAVGGGAEGAGTGCV